jgi:hypothetical protein
MKVIIFNKINFMFNLFIRELFWEYLFVKNFEKRLLASKQIVKPIIKIDIIKTFL